MHIEDGLLPGICFHYIDVERVKREWDERIEQLRGGGGTKNELAAIKELKRSRVDYAKYHNTIHTLDDKAIALERATEDIRTAYEAKNLAGAESHDREYRRLRDQWRTVAKTYPYYMIPGFAPRHTSLKTNWEILKDVVKDESLVRGGTDEQHEREIFNPYR